MTAKVVENDIGHLRNGICEGEVIAREVVDHQTMEEHHGL